MASRRGLPENVAGRSYHRGGACPLCSYRKTAKYISPVSAARTEYLSCRFESRDRCHLLLFDNAFIFWIWLSSNQRNKRR
jgi:hypothetical protein